MSYRVFLCTFFSALLAAVPILTAAQTAQPSATPTGGALDTAAAAKVDSTVTAVMGAAKIPGLTLAIARDGTAIYAHGYGYANVALQMPATTQTHYEIGSITKQFTATAVLQLKESGKLSLDDTVHRWIPEYARAKSVTIRELLQQTTGIPNYTEVKHFASIATTKPASFPAILALIAKKPLEFKPGSKFEYSNTNYILLGEIVERASGVSWEDYVRMHLFTPAGMTQSGFISEEARLQPMATGYVASKTGVTISPRFKEGWAWSAGAIVSTVGDMFAWDGALFGGRLINQSDLAAMLAPGKEMSKGSFYGFGWVIDTADGHTRYWHNGGTFGFLSANLIFPKDHIAIVVLQNADAIAAPQATAQRIFEAIVPSAAAVATPGEDPAVTARVREWINRFETGNIDRSQLDSKMSALLTPQLVDQVKAQFGPLGAPQQLVYRGKTMSEGSPLYTYRAVFAATTLTVFIAINGAGKISGFLFRP